jgi:hypothetical protein
VTARAGLTVPLLTVFDREIRILTQKLSVAPLINTPLVAPTVVIIFLQKTI